MRRAKCIEPSAQSRVHTAERIEVRHRGTGVEAGQQRPGACNRAPIATAAALATTDGQVAAHGSSVAALQSSLTTGLAGKADQSAFDVLEGVVATKKHSRKRRPEAAKIQHHSCHERLHRLGEQRHASHSGQVHRAERIEPSA